LPKAENEVKFWRWKMSAKQVITMSEFKTVVESFRSDMKKLTEVVNHRFDKVENKIRTMKEQISLLHEGQAEIKNELKQKVDRNEFGKLEIRVARLESKVA
jgi:hypothetical protein